MMMSENSQIDPSSFRPIVKWSEEWWANAKPEVQARRCKAHKKDGSRCGKAAMNNQRVCGTHGGKARHSVEAARRRMMENADPAVKKLTEIAYDPKQSAEIRLKATLAIIDRAGLSPRQAMEIEVGPAKPYEVVLESVFEPMTGGSREAHRSGSPPPALADHTRQLPAANHEPIDAQIVDDSDDDNTVDLSYYTQPITPERDKSGSVFDSRRFGPTSAPPADGLMPLDEANREIARLRRQAAQVNPEQRALPPGRSGR